MGPKTNILLNLLKQLAVLLKRNNHQHWASWIQKDIALIKSSDLYGVRHFLSAFGGAGSFNDIFPFDSHGDIILNRAYRIAKEIERESITNN